MAELRVGDKLKDNDPRMGNNRILTITNLAEDHIYVRNSMGRVFKYLRRRIFTDGKTRRTGFSRIGTDAASSDK